ncbi:MAG TPA: tRNA (adenosine(37)-N6)-threonylcarbamoyltransferase complex dimerization subunit type 1 TsaB [Terracidiphilus sp.]|nr:tRNA (adenosine(37)-N6)-threonylcarbamoyltransferase complex dimerization subunit type 1 TsaB [Terracidiphilus sp.]
MLLLGIDTCGPAGSVALGRMTGAEVSVLGETPLEGKTYSATLVAAVSDLLPAHGIKLAGIGCIVAVSGPGSFTGVRVGLSVVKGLAEGAGLRVVAVSRLEVLAQKSHCANAALDAHRHEVFLRVDGHEMLAGAQELASMVPPAQVAVCDHGAEDLLGKAWPGTELVHVPVPLAGDALRIASGSILAGHFADIALLDGHYLRRSDAEIFGEKQQSAPASPENA